MSNTKKKSIRGEWETAGMQKRKGSILKRAPSLQIGFTMGQKERRMKLRFVCFSLEGGGVEKSKEQQVSRTLRSEYEQLVQGQQATTTKLHNLESDHDGMLRRLDDVETERQQLMHSIRQLESQKDDLHAKVLRAERERGQMLSTLDSFEGAKSAIESKIRYYEQERRGMLERVASVQLGRDEAERKVVRLQQDKEVAERKAREAEEAAKRAEALVEEFRRRSVDAETRTAESHREKAYTEASVDKMRAAVKVLQDKVLELESNRSQMMREVETVQEERRRAEGAIARAIADRDQAERERQFAQDQVSLLKAGNKLLEPQTSSSSAGADSGPLLEMLHQRVAQQQEEVQDVARQLSMYKVMVDEKEAVAVGCQQKIKDLESIIAELRAHLTQQMQINQQEVESRNFDVGQLVSEAQSGHHQLRLANATMAAELEGLQRNFTAASDRATQAEELAASLQRNIQELHEGKEQQQRLVQRARAELSAQAAALRRCQVELKGEVGRALQDAQREHASQLGRMFERCEEGMEHLCRLAAADAGRQIAEAREEKGKATSLVESLRGQVAALQQQRAVLLAELQHSAAVLHPVVQASRDSEQQGGGEGTEQAQPRSRGSSSGGSGRRSEGAADGLERIVKETRSMQEVLVSEVAQLRQQKAALLAYQSEAEQQLRQRSEGLESLVGALSAEVAVPLSVQVALKSQDQAAFQQGVHHLRQAIRSCLQHCREDTVAALEEGVIASLQHAIEELQREVERRGGHVVMLQREVGAVQMEKQGLLLSGREALERCREQCMEAANEALREAIGAVQEELEGVRDRVSALQRLHTDDITAHQATTSAALDSQRQLALLGLDQLEEAAVGLQAFLAAESDRADALSAEVAKMQTAAAEQERATVTEGRRMERQLVELERAKSRIKEAEAATTAAQEESRTLRRSLRSQQANTLMLSTSLPPSGPGASLSRTSTMMPELQTQLSGTAAELQTQLTGTAELLRQRTASPADLQTGRSASPQELQTQLTGTTELLRQRTQAIPTDLQTGRSASPQELLTQLSATPPPT